MKHLPLVSRAACGCCAALVIGLALAAPADAAKRRPAAAHKAAASRTSKGDATSSSGADSNQVLVRVGKEAITRGDVQRRIESLPEQFRSNYATPEGRQQLLERMVEEKVWLSVALKNGVADRPTVKQQLEQQRRDLIVRTYLNEVMASNPAPSDSEARVYYDSHPSDYKVPANITVKHIQLKTEAEAKRVKLMMRGKYDWNALAKRFSTDTLTRANGGSLGTVTKEGVFASIGAQPELAEEAFAMTDSVGGPFKTDKGWHILKVENKKAESVRPFDQVRQMIVRQLSSSRSQEFYKQRLDEARQSLGVKPDSSAIKSFTSQKKSARDMFNEAQGISAPEARIAAYQKLLQDYPESDVSPQAQFMVGFIYSEELKKYDDAEHAFRELLNRYPKAELAPSAEWMLQHMREENAPPFINLEGDSTTVGSTVDGSPAPNPPNPNGGARRVKPWSPPRKP